jgi:osmotically-inducible protein OsmY
MQTPRPERGPERPDDQVEAAVREVLLWDRQVDSRAIAVHARDRTVTLRGAVETLAQKRAAQAAAERVAGVAGVENELHVRPLESLERANADLRAEVLRALATDTLVPESIDAVVYDHVVTLRGTVRRGFRRQAAEDRVRDVRGVTDVRNEIDVERDR